MTRFPTVLANLVNPIQYFSNCEEFHTIEQLIVKITLCYSKGI